MEPPAYSCRSCVSGPSSAALGPVGVVCVSVMCHLRVIEVEGGLVGLTQRSAHDPPDENAGRAQSHQYGQRIRTQYFVLCHSLSSSMAGAKVPAVHRLAPGPPSPTSD